MVHLVEHFSLDEFHQEFCDSEVVWEFLSSQHPHLFHEGDWTMPDSDINLSHEKSRFNEVLQDVGPTLLEYLVRTGRLGISANAEGTIDLFQVAGFVIRLSWAPTGANRPDSSGKP